MLRLNNIRMYILRSGRVVVFPPFGRYVFYSNLALAIEMQKRTLTPESKRAELASLEDTMILDLGAELASLKETVILELDAA